MENNKRKTPIRKRTSDDAPKGKISIKEAIDAMYYHTAKANTVYYWMVAAILILAPRNSTPIILALVALLLGLAQNLWQGVTLELFVRYLNGKGDKSFTDYPDHISDGGWVFYLLKLFLAVLAVLTYIVEIS